MTAKAKLAGERIAAAPVTPRHGTRSVLPFVLLIGGIIAAFRQRFHLCQCPNLATHLSLTLENRLSTCARVAAAVVSAVVVEIW
jgi:hypothetical protein